MPTSMPRTRNVLTMRWLPSVTGKAEKMPSVVHEFVHIHAADERGCSLLGADEIDRNQQNQAGENRPRQPFAEGNSRYGNGRCECCVCHLVPLGFRVPLELNCREEGLTLGPLPRGPNTVARPCRIFTGFLVSRNRVQNKKRCPLLS